MHLHETLRDPGEAPRARAWAERLRSPRVVRFGVGALVAASCLAVATVAAWLVVPYAALMGWLLIDPARAGRRPAPIEAPATPLPVGPEPAREAAELPAEPARLAADSPPPATPEPHVPAAEAIASAAATAVLDGGDDVGPDATEAAPRRRRATGRRNRRSGRTAAAPEPLSVTWVQVGPGKFVRVEAPAATPPPAADDAAAPPAGDTLPEPEAPVEPSSPDPGPIAAVRPTVADQGPDPQHADTPTPATPQCDVAADPERPEPFTAADDEPVDALHGADTDIPQAGEVPPIDAMGEPGDAPASPGLAHPAPVVPETPPEFDEESLPRSVAVPESRPRRPSWSRALVAPRRSRRLARRPHRRRAARRNPLAGRPPSPRSATRRPLRRAHGRHTPRGPPRPDPAPAGASPTTPPTDYHALLARPRQSSSPQLPLA